MRKVVIHRPGSYDRLEIVDSPDPVPAASEVVVATSAIGVNYADVCVRWGVYESAKRFVGWPITPGFEFSGTVIAVGDQVRSVAPGDRVFGVTLFNAYSTHVKVHERAIWKLPAELTLQEAAVFPAVYPTAYHGLFQNVVIRPGMKVLIHSAAGGVGSALVQLSMIAGLEVTAIIGASHKLGHVRGLGAQHVIDKSREDLWEAARASAPEGFDLVFDANGPSTLRDSYCHLAPTGKLVVYGFHSMLPKSSGRLNYPKAIKGWLELPRFNPLQMTSENKSLIAFNLSFLFDRWALLSEAMEHLLTWPSEKRLSPPVVTAIPFEDVAKAHQLIESGQSVGKIALIVND